MKAKEVELLRSLGMYGLIAITFCNGIYIVYMYLHVYINVYLYTCIYMYLLQWSIMCVKTVGIAWYRMHCVWFDMTMVIDSCRSKLSSKFNDQYSSLTHRKNRWPYSISNNATKPDDCWKRKKLISEQWDAITITIFHKANLAESAGHESSWKPLESERPMACQAVWKSFRAAKIPYCFQRVADFIACDSPWFSYSIVWFIAICYYIYITYMMIWLLSFPRI